MSGRQSSTWPQEDAALAIFTRGTNVHEYTRRSICGRERWMIPVASALWLSFGRAARAGNVCFLGYFGSPPSGSSGPFFDPNQTSISPRKRAILRVHWVSNRTGESRNDEAKTFSEASYR